MRHIEILDACQPLPLPSEMRQWDRAAHELGIPENVLMENAAQEAFAVLQRYQLSLRKKTIWFLMGSGNNGGDAACMARYAQNAGANPFILHRKPLKQYAGSTAKQIGIARALQIPFYRLRHAKLHTLPLPQADIIVDGLLGTGFQGALRPDMQELIQAINNSGRSSFVLALDIPSGLDGRTGQPSPVAIRADATATFAAYKPGLVLSRAKTWTGDTHLCPIGFPKALYDTIPCSTYMVTEQCLEKLLIFPEQSYKNIFGHVCVIGGSAGLEGAAHLAARSALRTGAGLVTVMSGAHSMPCIKSGWPEIICLPLDMPHNANWPGELPSEICEKLPTFSTLVLGPGLGRSANAAQFLGKILQTPNRPPAIIDADALTLMGMHHELLTAITDIDILTPHPGEAASLLGISNSDVQRDRFGALEQLCSKQPGVVVLKGACTLIGQQESPFLLSPYDIPQMAIGGSGDVLAGCLGAIRARANPEMDSLSVAAQGVLLHALTGEVCAQQFPGRGNSASEMADAISVVLKHSYQRRNAG